MTQTIEAPRTVESTPAGEPVDKRWSRAEYDQLVEIGFFDGKRVELVEGRIIQISPQRVPHSVAVELMDRYLRSAFGPGHRFRVQSPFLTIDGSEPEPDFAVVVGDDPRASREHPSSAVLIVEISESTVRHDRHKARLYAATGIGDYWIVNLIARTVEVHRDPLPNGGGETGPAYATVRVVKESETIAPLAAPGATVTVAELLP